MTDFFTAFPTIPFDINYPQDRSNYEAITNIFFRLGIIQKVIDNVSAYFPYTIRDGDLPEIIAEKVYGTPDAYWIILMANRIRDAQWDWPLSYDVFNKYLRDKYGSVANAQTQIHHYEKVIDRVSASGELTTTRFQIDNQSPNYTSIDAPYDIYIALPDEGEYQTFNFGDGKESVQQRIYRNAVSCYDWEDQQNENKRLIKIIKPEFYPQIISEFKRLTGANVTPFTRGVS